MENPQTTQPPTETPDTDSERLVQMLDAQLAAQRATRRPRPTLSGRTAFRIGALVAIFALLLAALAVLQWMLSEVSSSVHQNRHGHPAPRAFPAR